MRAEGLTAGGGRRTGVEGDDPGASLSETRSVSHAHEASPLKLTHYRAPGYMPLAGSVEVPGGDHARSPPRIVRPEPMVVVQTDKPEPGSIADPLDVA